jgi:cytochrome c oxidase assembly protein subunit 15
MNRPRVAPLARLLRPPATPRTLFTHSAFSLWLAFQAHRAPSGGTWCSLGSSRPTLPPPTAVARVSQYRPAAHLSAVLILYACLCAAAITIKADWRFARDGSHGTWSRLADGHTWEDVLCNPLLRRFKTHTYARWSLDLYSSRRSPIRLKEAMRFTRQSIGLKFQAHSSLDLMLDSYATIPANGWAALHHLSASFSRRNAPPPHLTTATTTKIALALWRDFFENPTTVQFKHR